MAGPSIGRPRRPSVLIVGAASRDLDRADPRGWRLGVDGAASAAHELEFLRRQGVEVRLVALAGGPVFDNQRLPGGARLQYAHGLSDALAAGALPAEWAINDAVVLSPVAGEIGDDWADAFGPQVIVALGWQGILRRLHVGQRVESLPMGPRPLLERADLNVVSAEDAIAGGRPIEELLPRAGQQLVITNGPRPAVQLVRQAAGTTVRLLPVRPVWQPRDETGAGDVLLAGWAAATAAASRSDRPRATNVLAVAVAAASLHVERAGLDGVPDLRRLCERLLRPPAGQAPAG
jgi:sugar/nucleoside kinase (ribokinase family)